MTIGEQLQGSGERISTRTVTFRRPFTLGKSNEVFPAGIYEVETVEQAIETVAHTAFVRRSQTLIIGTASGLRCREIIANELDTALQHDINQQLTEPSENPDREHAAAR